MTTLPVTFKIFNGFVTSDLAKVFQGRACANRMHVSFEDLNVTLTCQSCMPRLKALSAHVAQKIKPQKLPIKWRTAQELYAEEQLSWNLSQTVVNSSKKQGSTGGEMYKAILEDIVADWNSGKISDNKKRPFEEKESGASAHSEWRCCTCWRVVLLQI
jgi:hypothetical protein